MLKKTVPGTFLALLLLNVLTLVLHVQRVEASETIYIRANGLVEGTDKITSSDNVTYTFTDNINDSIVIERDNIVLDGAGYVLQGQDPGFGTGIDISYRSNVTIEDCEVRLFNTGIYIFESSNISTSQNRIVTSPSGIWLRSSVYSRIYGNTIISSQYGITLTSVYHNEIIGNNITTSVLQGIYIYNSSTNSIYHNNFVDNEGQVESVAISVNVWDAGYPSGGNYWSDYTGVDLYSGPNQDQPGSDGIGDTPYVIDENNQDNYPIVGPSIPAYHDVAVTDISRERVVIGEGFPLKLNVSVENQGNFEETFNVTVQCNSTALGFPDGKDYTTVTLTSGSSTIINIVWNTTGFAKGSYRLSAYAWPVPGETYTADNNFIDGWVYVGIPGDVDGNGLVEIKDILAIAIAYGSYPGHPNYQANLDVNGDEFIDAKDILWAAIHYGQHYP